MIYVVCWGKFGPSKIIGGRGAPYTTSICYSAKVCILYLYMSAFQKHLDWCSDLTFEELFEFKSEMPFWDTLYKLWKSSFQGYIKQWKLYTPIPLYGYFLQ